MKSISNFYVINTGKIYVSQGKLMETLFWPMGNKNVTFVDTFQIFTTLTCMDTNAMENVVYVVVLRYLKMAKKVSYVTTC